jgi:hypothetical protein
MRSVSTAPGQFALQVMPVAVEVPVQRLLPGLVTEIPDQGPAVGAAGVVHHDVEPPVPLVGEVHERLYLLLLHGVAREERGPVARTHLCERLLALVLGAAAHHDGGALGEEELCDPATDASGARRDDGDLALELPGARAPAALVGSGLTGHLVCVRACGHAIVSARGGRQR